MSKKLRENKNASAPSSDSTPGQTPPEIPLADSLDASTLHPDLTSALAGLIAEYRTLGAQIADLQATQAGLKSTVEAICLDIPSKRIIALDAEGNKLWSTTRTAKTTSRLNETKLMTESTSRGYDPVEVKAIITASTDKIKGKEYVIIND